MIIENDYKEITSTEQIMNCIELIPCYKEFLPEKIKFRLDSLDAGKHIGHFYPDTKTIIIPVK